MNVETPRRGGLPNRDGALTEYLPSGGHSKSRWFHTHRRALFVNGIKNSPSDHQLAAEMLSLLLMTPVVGIYNKTDGFVSDSVQCIRDKATFHGLSHDSPHEIAAHAGNSGAGVNGITAAARAAIEKELSKNLCTLKLFHVLRDPRWHGADVHAHSQGNLILCNALWGLVALGDTAAIAGRKFYSYGSPVVAGNWPPQVRSLRQEYGFSLDYVTVLSRFGSSWSASTVGLTRRPGWPWSHGFERYLQNMPDFIINTHRVGGLGVTFSMDERGLAEHLVQLSHKLVLDVFDRLRTDYSLDFDDVALEYVRALERRRGPEAIRQLRVRDPYLHRRLREAMARGWTSSTEKHYLALLG